MEIGMNAEVNHWLFIYTRNSFSAITILKQEKQIFFFFLCDSVGPLMTIKSSLLW